MNPEIKFILTTLPYITSCFLFFLFFFCLKELCDVHDTLSCVKRKIGAFLQTHNFRCGSSRRFIVNFSTFCLLTLERVCVGSEHKEPSVELRLSCVQ